MTHTARISGPSCFALAQAQGWALIRTSWAVWCRDRRLWLAQEGLFAFTSAPTGYSRYVPRGGRYRAYRGYVMAMPSHTLSIRWNETLVCSRHQTSVYGWHLCHQVRLCPQGVGVALGMRLDLEDTGRLRYGSRLQYRLRSI